MEEGQYNNCKPMRRRMNKWVSKCQDKYIVVQPIGMRRKADREKGKEGAYSGVIDREAV